MSSEPVARKWITGELRVEPARLRDALPILGIHREVLEEGVWFATRPDELRLTLEDQEDRLRNATNHGVLLVARLPSRPVVGWLALTAGTLARTSHTARMELMVGATHRGQGVGRALVSAALDWATLHPHVAKIGLAVYAHNDRAIALYRSFGFEDEGLRYGEYRMEDGSWRDDRLLFKWVKPRDSL